MKLWHWCATSMAIVLLAGALAVCQETHPDKPTKTQKKEAKAPATKPVRLVQPWSKLAMLSDEQKQKIDAIHHQALAETKAIEEKEKADILALLSDAQKAELQAALDKDTADRKAKDAQRQAEKAAKQAQPNPASQPAEPQPRGNPK